EIAVRYRAATAGMHIGGDWYDVVVRRDGMLTVTLGDVVGHGIDAAVLMSRLRNRLRLLLAEATLAADTLDRLDRDVGDQMAGDFATVVVALIDEQRHLTFASAGHPPPLVLEPGEPPRFVESAHGPPIGIDHRDPR